MQVRCGNAIPDNITCKNIDTSFVLILQVVVEELEARIVTCHEKGAEDEAGYERANQASAAARVLVGKTINTPANSEFIYVDVAHIYCL